MRGGLCFISPQPKIWEPKGQAAGPSAPTLTYSGSRVLTSDCVPQHDAWRLGTPGWAKADGTRPTHGSPWGAGGSSSLQEEPWGGLAACKAGGVGGPGSMGPLGHAGGLGQEPGPLQSGHAGPSWPEWSMPGSGPLAAVLSGPAPGSFPDISSFGGPEVLPGHAPGSSHESLP